MWDDRYSEEGFAYGTEPNDFLVEAYSSIPPNGKVLCLAEGEGRNAVFLAQQGFNVTAVDLSSVGLKKATELATANNVSIETIQADLADFDLGENQWDGIVSIWAHTPESIRSQLHSRVIHALKPGGVFILEAYIPKHIDMPGVGGPPASQVDFFMPLDKLKSELSELTFSHAIEIDRHVSEGKYHQGESAVVQVIAKRK
jgi:SAM-dependent methyltransferase